MSWFSSDRVKVLLIVIIGIISLVAVIGCFLIPAEILAMISVLIIGTINEAFWWAGWEEYLRVLAALGFYILAISLSLFILRPNSTHDRRSELKKSEIILWLTISGVSICITIFLGPLSKDSPVLFWLAIGFICVVGLYPLIAWKMFHLELEDIGISKKNTGSALIIGGGLGIGYGFVSAIWHCCRVNTIIEAVETPMTLAMVCCLTLFCVYGGILLSTRLNPYVAFIISSLIYGFIYPWHTIWFALGYALFGFFLCLLYYRTGNYITVYVGYFTGFLTHAIVPWRGFIVTCFLIIPLGTVFAIFLTFYLIYLIAYKNKKSSIN